MSSSPNAPTPPQAPDTHSIPSPTPAFSADDVARYNDMSETAVFQELLQQRTAEQSIPTPSPVFSPEEAAQFSERAEDAIFKETLRRKTEGLAPTLSERVLQQIGQNQVPAKEPKTTVVFTEGEPAVTTPTTGAPRSRQP